MRSKEVIIDTLIRKYSKKQLHDEKVIQKIQYDAMDIYAKKVAIDFAVYIRNNWLPEEGKKYTWWNPESNKFLYSEELFDAYLQSKK